MDVRSYKKRRRKKVPRRQEHKPLLQDRQIPSIIILTLNKLHNLKLLKKHKFVTSINFQSKQQNQNHQPLPHQLHQLREHRQIAALVLPTRNKI